MNEKNFIRITDTLTCRPPVAMQIGGPSSAQNLRGAARREQQLRSAPARFLGKQQFLRTGTFFAKAGPAIDGQLDVASADEAKKHNTNYPREENVR